MRYLNRWVIVSVAVTVVALLGGCDKSQDAVAKPAAKAATMEPTEESGIRRITLTEDASRRLAIELTEVSGDGDRLVVPFGALIYDASGGEWVYVSPQPQVFKRAAVKVDRITGGKVYLISGPASGTKVVSVGAPELHGVDFGIGK